MALITVVLVACAGPPAAKPIASGPTAPVAAPATAPAQAPPAGPALLVLDGRPVYDVPLEQAPAAVQRVWKALAPLDAEKLEPPEPSEREQWMREEMKPWFEARIDAIDAAKPDLEDLAAGAPRDRLLARVLEARLYDAIVRSIDGLAGAFDPTMAASAKEALADQAAPFAARASSAYADAATAAAEAPPMLQPWGDVCRARVGALTALATRPATPPRARPPSAPPECVEPTQDPSLDAPPPDPSRPAEIAVVYEGTRLRGAAKRRLLAEATRFVDGARPEAIVSERDLQRAEALVAQRRWSKGSPVCKAAPPLVAVVAAEHQNLLVAHVSTECRKERCELAVWFTRAGTPDADGLPARASAAVAEPARPQAWIDAVARLAPSAEAAVLGVVSSSGSASGAGTAYLHVGNPDVADPLLGVRSALQARGDALRACHPGHEVTSLDVAWTISPTGAATGVTVTPISEGDADLLKVEKCVAGVLARTPFRCPRSGQATPARATICIRK